MPNAGSMHIRPCALDKFLQFEERKGREGKGKGTGKKHPHPLYSIPATTTAPPTTHNISLPHPRVIVASPVCRPGLDPVDVVPTPAVPLGVSPALLAPLMIVTAVTTLLLPLARVLVWYATLVWALAGMEVVGEEPLLGVMVRAPPPTVETTMRPTPLVVVITSPAVREMELPPSVMGAAVGVDVKEPTTGEPFVSVLVVATTTGAAALVSSGEAVEIGATGAMGVVADSGLLFAEVVAGVVPLLMSCRFTNSGFMSLFVRLARLMMLVARVGSVL